MFIYRNLIVNYINHKLTPEIIKVYASNNSFPITTSESIIIYNFIKRNYNLILNGNNEIIKSLKCEVRDDLYNKVYDLYIYYKSKLDV